MGGRIMKPDTETPREQWVRMARQFDYAIEKPARGVMVAVSCMPTQAERDKIRGFFGKGNAWMVDPTGQMFSKPKPTNGIDKDDEGA